MLARTAIVIGALSACAICWAQSTVRLTFPSAGKRFVWAGSTLPDAVPASATEIAGDSYEFKLGASAPDQKLFVFDAGTGNISVKTVESAVGGWVLAESDAKWIGNVVVRVESKGLPVAAAEVKLKDSAREQQSLLDPTSKGEAKFFGVLPGTLKVAVSYGFEGKKHGPITQVFEVGLKRDRAEPQFGIVVPDPVPTVGESAFKTPKDTAGNSEPGEAEKPKRSGVSAFGLAIVYLAALAGAVMLILYGLKMIKQHPEAVEQQLAKLGVKIPIQDKPPAPSDTVVPLPPAPVPQAKILLDDAAPTPLADAPIIAAEAPQASGRSPVLAGPTGRIELLAESIVVGREAGPGIEVVADPSVSRRHATLHHEGTKWVLEDQGSTNGTFVNGRRLDDPVELRPGDEVRFGAVAFRFEV